MGGKRYEVLGIVPARGGSKGIPHKNITDLCGKPLLAYTAEAARGSRLLTRTILSSDSERIMAVGREWGLEVPFRRPDELAQDATPGYAAIVHAVEFLEREEGYRPDYVCILQPTSPLRTSRHIDEALEMVLGSDADSVVSVVQVPHNCSPYSVMERDGDYVRPFLEYDEKKNIRQLKPVFWARNGAAVYAFTLRCLLEKGSVFGDRILAYEMTREDSVDIDEPLDLELAAFMLERREKQAS